MNPTKASRRFVPLATQKHVFGILEGAGHRAQIVARRQKPPSFRVILNDWRVPKDAAKALRLGESPEIRIIENRSVMDRMLDLDALVALHLKHLAYWARKGAMTRKDFDARRDKAWRTFQDCQMGVSLAEWVRANSFVELMRRVVLEQGEGYYEAKYGKK